MLEDDLAVATSHSAIFQHPHLSVVEEARNSTHASFMSCGECGTKWKNLTGIFVPGGSLEKNKDLVSTTGKAHDHNRRRFGENPKKKKKKTLTPSIRLNSDLFLSHELTNPVKNDSVIMDKSFNKFSYGGGLKINLKAILMA